MGEKLPPQQNALYQGIDQIFWNDWDPIGINIILSGRDEYHSYVPIVFKMVIDGATSQELKQYLEDVAKNRMGLRSRKISDKPIADKIIELKNQLGL